MAFMIFDSKFKPAWWLTNPHLQTIAAKWLKKNQPIDYIKETIELPDGDFIDLAWSEKPDLKNNKPLVVILHGLAGSVESHYAKGMLNTLKHLNWLGVLMHFRGCSGRPNRMAQSYHSGDTRDIGYLTQLLSQRFPRHPKFVIGYSLGGNVLTKYLAETPDNPYQAACVICAPLDLASCSQRINSGFSKIYQKYLVDMLKTDTQSKINQKLVTNISQRQLSTIRSIKAFDHQVTAPLNGFLSADEYYQKASGAKVIKNIQQPCLFIHAADDPFLNHQTLLPTTQLPSHIRFEVSHKGGHVGFITGNNPLKPQYWLEQRIPEFLRSYM